MKKVYDIAIIGAGIIGAMTARELTKYNFKVCVLEKENDVANGATKANSAIVHAGFDAMPGTLKAKLNVEGSKLMENVCKELGVKYIKNGALVIGFDDSDKDTITALYERGKKNGVDGIEVIGRERLREIEPNISENAKCALYAPTSAIICPYKLCIAAMGNAMDNGADLKLNFEVTDIKDNGEYFEIFSHSEKVCAKYVINAAGVFSDVIAGLAGDTSFKVHARKGEYILLDKDAGSLTSHTIFKTPGEKGKGILVSPTVDGNFIMGPTAQDISNKDDKSTSADGLDSIKSQAVKFLGNPPFEKTITSFSGLRAVGNTGDFIIKFYKDRFINAAGIESPGLSASPAIAIYIKDMLKSKGITEEKNLSFNPIRKPDSYFKNASLEEKNKIIKENPEFGKVICRCESVTMGEITDAIRKNPGARDIDGVKRRTRSGMGRCQGGFCMPYVAEILSKELGIPIEDVTKCGGNSKIGFGKTKEEKR